MRGGSRAPCEYRRRDDPRRRSQTGVRLKPDPQPAGGSGFSLTPVLGVPRKQPPPALVASHDAGVPRVDQFDGYRSHLSVIAVVVLWAGSFSVIKALLDHGIAAIDIAILRYAIAVPGFAFILWRARGLPGLTRGDAVRVAAAGFLVVLGYHLFLNLGTQHTTSGVAALVVALAPGITVVLAEPSASSASAPGTSSGSRSPS